MDFVTYSAAVKRATQHDLRALVKVQSASYCGDIYRRQCVQAHCHQPLIHSSRSRRYFFVYKTTIVRRTDGRSLAAIFLAWQWWACVYVCRPVSNRAQNCTFPEYNYSNETALSSPRIKIWACAYLSAERLLWIMITCPAFRCELQVYERVQSPAACSPVQAL